MSKIYVGEQFHLTALLGSFLLTGWRLQNALQDSPFSPSAWSVLAYAQPGKSKPQDHSTCGPLAGHVFGAQIPVKKKRQRWMTGGLHRIARAINQPGTYSRQPLVHFRTCFFHRCFLNEAAGQLTVILSQLGCSLLHHLPLLWWSCLLKTQDIRRGQSPCYRLHFIWLKMNKSV